MHAFVDLNSFHIHPLAIKVQKNNINYFKEFFPSFDEAFVSIFSNDNKYYISKDSSEMIFASLASKKNLKILESNHINDTENLIYWASRFTNQAHRNFVKKSYILKKDDFSENEINNAKIVINDFVKNLLIKINKKIRYNKPTKKKVKLLTSNFNIIMEKLKMYNYDDKDIKNNLKKQIENTVDNKLIIKILKDIYL